jgi:hypothetical protein
MTTNCSLSAKIECSLASDATRACESLGAPSVSKCSGATAQELRYIYNAKPCTASNSTGTVFECSDSNGGPTSSQVFILITSFDETKSYFSGVVQPGVIFGTSSNDTLSDRIKIKVSSLIGGAPDQLLQSVLTSVSCVGEASDVSLLTQYGSLELTAFKNAVNGFQSAVEIISQTFVVSNAGADNATLIWANMTSTIYGTTALVSSPGVQISSGQSVSFPFDTTPINLYASRGQTFTSTLDIAGEDGNHACADSAALSIVVGA